GLRGAGLAHCDDAVEQALKATADSVAAGGRPVQARGEPACTATAAAEQLVDPAVERGGAAAHPPGGSGKLRCARGCASDARVELVTAARNARERIPEPADVAKYRSRRDRVRVRA